MRVDMNPTDGHLFLFRSRGKNKIKALYYELNSVWQAIRYCLMHWEKLTNYLKDGRIEIDNNSIENVIRPFAISRKNGYLWGVRKGQKQVLYFSL